MKSSKIEVDIVSDTGILIMLLLVMITKMIILLLVLLLLLLTTNESNNCNNYNNNNVIIIKMIMTIKMNFVVKPNYRLQTRMKKRMKSETNDVYEDFHKDKDKFYFIEYIENSKFYYKVNKKWLVKWKIKLKVFQLLNLLDSSLNCISS